MQLTGQVQEGLESHRAGQVRDDHAVEHRPIDDVYAADETPGGPCDPERMGESRVGVRRPVEGNRDSSERHVITTPA